MNTLIKVLLVILVMSFINLVARSFVTASSINNRTIQSISK